MSTRPREAMDGPAPKTRRQVPVLPERDADHPPDPVTLCEPSFDDTGLLRWRSTKY